MDDKTRQTILPFLVVMVLLVTGAITFIPKLSSRVFPLKRERMLRNFLSQTKKAGTIDSRSFWIFREFYSPGQFTLNKDGFQGDYIAPIKGHQFLRYSSDRINGIEALVTEASLSAVISYPRKLRDCIIKQSDELICYQSEKELVVLFVKPFKDLERTNGFMDYKDKQVAELTKGKHWLLVSIIKL